MKNFLIILIISIALISYGAVDCHSAARPNSKKGIYYVQGRAGGTTGDLDTLDITGSGSPNAYDLIESDGAIVGIISGTTADYYFYILDSDGTDAESDPHVIRPDDYSTATVWRLANIYANSFNAPKISGTAGLSSMVEANSTDTSYVGWMGPASIAESFSHQFSDTQPSGSFYLWGTPTGTGDPNGNKISACTIVTPGANVTTWMATPSSANLASAVTGETGSGALVFATSPTLVTPALGTPASGTLTNCSGYPSASTTTSGIAEHATTAETSTGTDTGRIVTPDGLSGSVYGQKEIGWTVHDSDASTAVADGKQAAVVPASMNGMNLIDVTCSIADQNSASGGTTTVVLRRVRAGTPQDMTSTGVTIAYNEYTASDEVVNTSYDDVQTGDNIYVDINAVTTGAVHLGLSCTAVFQTP